MREIKFRGKFKKEGEWEYGGIRFGDMGQAYILPHGASHRIELVNRDTVGQYTGLKDKNGKEIYEGDILMGAGIVAWNDVEVRWSCIDIEWNDKREWHDMLYLTTPLEVIGNVYENADLLTNK